MCIRISARSQIRQFVTQTWRIVLVSVSWLKIAITMNIINFVNHPGIIGTGLSR
jgi:hypothetical protein